MSDRKRAVVFDLDAASLCSLREALADWDIEVVNGASAGSLTEDWNPRPTDLFVVKARAEVVETLGMCRLLVFRGAFSTERPDNARDRRGRQQQPKELPPREDTPLLVLVPPREEALVRAALRAGADSCLELPVHAKQLTDALARVRRRDQPGAHTLHLDPAQPEDRWRDDGGQG
jgi:CheY-like chemotaxis protein